MIRKFVFLRRAPGGSQDAVLEALRKAPIGAAGSRRILNVAQPEIPDLMPVPIWDVVEETELSDAQSGREALRDDHGLDALPAEVDPEQVVQFMAQAKVVLDGPARGVRVLSLPRRRSGMSPDSFSRHYREIHGALVAQNQAFVTNCNRYVQHHVLPETVRATGGFVPYDGMSEFWFDSLDKARASWGDPSYMTVLRADEKNFVGSPPSHRILVVPEILGPIR